MFSRKVRTRRTSAWRCGGRLRSVSATSARRRLASGLCPRIPGVSPGQALSGEAGLAEGDKQLIDWISPFTSLGDHACMACLRTANDTGNIRFCGRAPTCRLTAYMPTLLSPMPDITATITFLSVFRPHHATYGKVLRSYRIAGARIKPLRDLLMGISPISAWAIIYPIACQSGRHVAIP